MIVYLAYGTFIFQNNARRNSATNLLNNAATVGGAIPEAVNPDFPAGVANVANIDGKPALMFSFRVLDLGQAQAFLGEMQNRYNLEEGSSWGVSGMTVPD